MPSLLSRRRLEAARRAHASRRGVALLAVVPILVVLLVLVVALSGLTVDGSRTVERRVDVYSARSAAETATRLAVESLWSEFLLANGTNAVRLQSFQAFLDGHGIRNQAAVAMPNDTELLPRLALASDGAGETVVGGTVIESVRMRRIDEVRRLRLEFSTTTAVRRAGERMAAGDTRRTVEDVYVVEPPSFEGLDFALLANNINCVMCHTSVDNVERVYNHDESARGTFDRVRTGSIESFMSRSDPESTIAGTLYVGGGASDESGHPLSDWAGLSMDGFTFDHAGHIAEGLGGTLTQVDLVPADPVNPLPLGNLYLDYFANAGDVERFQVDGVLPTSFPAPFPDDGGIDVATFTATPEGAGNGLVDDNEFLATVYGASGVATGGNISLVPFGSVIATASDVASLQSGTDSLTGLADGNVFMHGTAANPIRLSGDLAIAGDLILSGVVEGEGNLQVRGNIFIAGDLVYNDAVVGGNRVFGIAEDGGRNVVTLAAGKNIVVGDMYHPAWGAGAPANGRADGSWNFAMDEIAIFNRMEWMRTQPTLPGEPVYEVVRQEDRRRELLESVSVTTDEPVYEMRGDGTFTSTPIYATRGTGVFVSQPTYTWQQTGTRAVPVYETIHHPADPPEPYGAPWTERVQVGTTDEPVFAWVETGSRMVEQTERVVVGTNTVENRVRVQTGTRPVTRTVNRPYDPPRYEDYQVPIYEWVTPQHANPHYRGPDYRPRYYSFDEGAPVPIYNKEGHFDPATQVWIAPERAGAWDESKLTFADPSDPRDATLFHADGTPRAVVSTLSPADDWIGDDLLKGIVEEAYRSRDPLEPLAVDAWLYSSNSIFAVVAGRNSPGVDGRMRINGAVIAADLGLLAPNGLEINYDRRGRLGLDVASESRLTIRREFRAPGDERRRGAVDHTLPH